MRKKILVVLTMCGFLFCGNMNTFAAGGRNYVDQNNDGICDFYGISECVGKFCGGLRQSGLRVGAAAQNIKNSNIVDMAGNVENGTGMGNGYGAGTGNCDGTGMGHHGRHGRNHSR